jgi:hypothetical protein
VTTVRTIASHDDATLRVAIYTAVACLIATAVYTLARIEPLPIMSLLLAFGPLVAVILWLQKDGRRARLGVIQDWGFFVWLAWPIVIPWYAFTG